MAEERYKKTFYAGADYGLDSNYGNDFSLNFGYRMPVSQFGIPADPRTANQLKAVSDRLNTGAKTIEVSGVTSAQWEMVPEQHLKEIERLKHHPDFLTHGIDVLCAIKTDSIYGYFTAGALFQLINTPQ